MHNNERIILKLNQVVDEIEGDEYGVKQLLLKEVKSGQAEKLPWKVFRQYRHGAGYRFSCQSFTDR